MRTEANVSSSIYQMILCPIKLYGLVVLGLLLSFSFSSFVWHPCTLKSFDLPWYRCVFCDCHIIVLLSYSVIDRHTLFTLFTVPFGALFHNLCSFHLSYALYFPAFSPSWLQVGVGRKERLSGEDSSYLWGHALEVCPLF